MRSAYRMPHREDQFPVHEVVQGGDNTLFFCNKLEGTVLSYHRDCASFFKAVRNKTGIGVRQLMFLYRTRRHDTRMVT